MMSIQYPISVKNLTVLHDNNPIIYDVSFDISAQQSLAVFGLNGAGKSTLLKTLMGLIPCYRGNCFIQGLPPYDFQSRQQLAYIPEKAELPLMMSGLDYLKIYTLVHRQPLDLLHIKHYAMQMNFDHQILSCKINTYSKGMQQKLMIIAGFSINAKIMIMDEVMSGLDILTRRAVRQLLTEYRQKGGVIVFTTHLWEDIQTFATNLLVLHNGRIIESCAVNDDNEDFKSIRFQDKIISLIQ